MQSRLNFIRGLVRPTVTWIGFASIVAMLALRVPVPEWYQVMIGMILAFWFGQRDRGHAD